MEKDRSGRAVEGAALIGLSTKRALKEIFSLGPHQVRMSPRELRQALRSPQQGMLKDVMQRLGPEQALELLMGAKTLPGPGNLDQYIQENDESTPTSEG